MWLIQRVEMGEDQCAEGILERGERRRGWIRYW
jgi:hypothetical protein